MPQVFVSYPREDSGQLASIERAVEKAGFSNWRNGVGADGEYAVDAASQALRESFCVVVLLTQNALGSARVEAEIGEALRLGIPIVPVLQGTDLGLLSTGWIQSLDGLNCIIFSQSINQSAQLELQKALGEAHQQLGGGGRVVSFVNFKGGVGKTTLCALSGTFCAAQTQQRVLLIDLDPQENMTDLFSSPSEIEATVAQSHTAMTLFEHRRLFADFGEEFDYEIDTEPCYDVGPTSFNKLPNALARLDNSDGSFDLICSDIRMVKFSISSAFQQTFLSGQFKTALDYLRQRYDLIFLDCGPSASLLTRSAFMNSDLVVAPVRTDNTAIRGISTMREAAQKLYGVDLADKIRVVFNFVRPDNQSDKAFIERFRREPETLKGPTLDFLKGQVFDSEIPYSDALIHLDHAFAPRRGGAFLSIGELIGRGLHRAEEPIKRLSQEIVEQLQASADRD